jgi:hypothetical protein
MTNAAQPLAAARGVESLLIGARDVLLDAEVLAKDGRLLMISRWIRERIDSLDDELLKEVRATVEALERRQAKEIDEALRGGLEGETEPPSIAELLEFCRVIEDKAKEPAP